MRQDLAIVGGPGSGKTRRMLDRVRGELAAGVPPEQVALLAFTRAARDEIRARLAEATGYSTERFPWLRTIHSAALSMCAGARLLTDDHWIEFAERYGYELTGGRPVEEDDVVVPPALTEHDQLRYVYEWGRNRRLEPAEAFDRAARAGVRWDLFALYVVRYEAFKREKGLVDFVDLLERVLATRASLPVVIGFVDEAQDLSLLQSEVVEVFFANCERLYAAGDDDQAIYLFQGAQAEWFMRISEREVLTVSHRLPSVVHAFSTRIIARNSNRIEKRFEPTARAGRIVQASYANATDCVDGSCPTLVLSRNRVYLRDQARALQSRAVPYVIEGEGWPNPLGSDRLVRAVNAAQALRLGDRTKLSSRALADLLVYVPPGSGLVTDELRVAVRNADRRNSWFEVDASGIANLVALVRAEGAMSCFTKLSGANARYLAKLLGDRDELPNPIVTLSSIHGAKGREADLVVLVSDMTRATYDEYQKPNGADGENRVFYVGVTRTRDTLVLADPKTRRRFNFPPIPSGVKQ